MAILSISPMITTGLSPNVERDDITLALTTVLQPWLWRHGPAKKLLSRALQNYFSTDFVWPVNSGRTALLILLQSLHLKSVDEILLQAFTCNAVPNPILWTGAKPVYVDIEANNYNMSPPDLVKKITPRSKVLIIQHTFGTPAKLDELLTIAKQHNLFVIEDCAHALGARYHNQLLGTFGDAAIFSFGRDKVISSVYGGALLTKQPFTLPAIPYPSRSWTLQQLAHPIITACAKKIRIILPIAQKMKLISLAVSPPERLAKQPGYFPAQLPNSLARLALQQFNKLQYLNDHRRTLASFYHQELKLSYWFDDSIYLRYPVQVSKPEQVLALAKQQGIILGDWYTRAVVPGDPGLFMYQTGSCPTAEHIARYVINLPTHIGIKTKQAKLICDVIQPYLHGTD